ncbi:unnamed protein product [Owenia fusiformis]|uniref:Small ribosomal subunit protein mS29 n=1 Tax=Owenia fusiformis TaxID=6347 RepID=A0A8J1U1P3_OWEFU|nr:unnamed protein product [Owenia fusiformis]
MATLNSASQVLPSIYSISSFEDQPKMSAPISRYLGPLSQRCVLNVLRHTPAVPMACSNCRCRQFSSKESLTVDVSNLAEMFRVAKQSSGKPLRRLFMTREEDPGRHTMQHEGLFYTMQPETHNVLFKEDSFTAEFRKQVETFNEMTLMVRRPAVEVISYLKQANYAYPPNKYLLYGSHGTGKTMSLAHIIHYCHSQGWMVLYVPWPSSWNNKFRYLTNSSYKADRWDLPRESVSWLKQFKTINAEILEKTPIKTRYSYEWTKREVMEKGSALTYLIEFGISRPKFSSDCIGALIKELKCQNEELGVRILLAIDGVNSFWRPTAIKLDNKEFADPDKITLIHNFKKLLQTDWSNGAVVGTVDAKASVKEERASFMPRYLLKKEGFEWLDPFVPIHVDDYNDKEVNSCIDYYVDKLWIQNPKALTEEGRNQLIFLTNKNPRILERTAAAW